MNRRIRVLFFHAKPNCRGCPTLRSICSSPTWAEHGDQRFAAVAVDRTVSLHRPDIDRRRLALVSLVAFWSLGTLRALRTGRSLGTGNALDALSTLWAGGALRSRLALGPWISSTSCKCKGNCKRGYADQSLHFYLPVARGIKPAGQECCNRPARRREPASPSPIRDSLSFALLAPLVSSPKTDTNRLYVGYLAIAKCRRIK
ncbi:hypothetical protein ACVWYQ_006349 [Bradyrhizobium sp. USDA 3397]